MLAMMVCCGTAHHVERVGKERMRFGKERLNQDPLHSSRFSIKKLATMLGNKQVRYEFALVR